MTARAVAGLGAVAGGRRVVSTGDSPQAGNGPAVTILLSAGDGSLRPRVDPAANLASMLGLP